MGACDFFVKQNGSCAKEAFTAAREQAQYEDGHGGYTGTIAEKDSFKMVSREPVTPEEARRILDKLFEDEDHFTNDKYAPAGCLEIASDDATTFVFFGMASS